MTRSCVPACAIRRRFGYRRLLVLVRHEGLVMNHKKFRRLYREERLQVRRRGGRKRALGTKAPLAILQGANQRWSRDFLSDAFADGRRFRILAVVDDFPRECLALVADTSLSGLRVYASSTSSSPGEGGQRCVYRTTARTDRHDRAVLQPGKADRVALHRARQADPKRLHREFQRPACATNFAMRRYSPSAPGSSRAGKLERRLQQLPAAQCAG
ncbi:hypothetical protein ABIB85_008441 [Bradyrhizobium sp. JR1.5]